jgi:beta-fructofuranosidase
VDWRYEQPLEGAPGQECPDLFKIGDTWYLIGGGELTYAKHSRGPYQRATHHVVDAPGVYAGKRMFDGKRHIWVGWAWDMPRLCDDDPDRTWGGTMCAPRELYPGPDGELYCKPADEIVAAFTETALDLADRPVPAASPEAAWHYDGAVLALGAEPSLSPVRFDVPGDALVTCVAEMDPAAELTLTLREQADTGAGYRFTVRPAKSQIAITTPFQEWVRDGCTIDASKPVKVQVFIVGTMLECYVNDAYAFTRRVYDLGEGQLGLRATGGDVRITELTVRTAP